MRTGPTLVLTEDIHQRLQEHLLPGDGKEAAAILLCVRMQLDQLKLLSRDFIPIPHDVCERYSNSLEWPSEYLEHASDRAEEEDLSIILVHSHPGGFYDFSDVDDRSDQLIIKSLLLAQSARLPTELRHGSAIVVPGGGIKARMYGHAMFPIPVELVAVYGDNIQFFWNTDPRVIPRPMAFSEAMSTELKRLKVAVIGISGTGSIAGEQLARMGFGEVFSIDYDRAEKRNLNRILNSTINDVTNKEYKVTIFKRAVASFSDTTVVHTTATSISSKEAVLQVANADIVVCCVDSDEGRNICDRMSSCFLQPLFDVGVIIPVRKNADGKAVIAEICGRIDYVKPGGSTLEERGVYSPASLAAEYLAKTDPAAYAARIKEGYMPGAAEEAPSVITVNMQAASACVQEFIARAYPYRLDGNKGFARILFHLASSEYEFFGEQSFPSTTSPLLATGLQKPLLGLPFLEDAQCSS